MRIALIESRARIVGGADIFDISDAGASASAGAGHGADSFGPDGRDAYDRRQTFLPWAATADLGPDEFHDSNEIALSQAIRSSASSGTKFSATSPSTHPDIVGMVEL